MYTDAGETNRAAHNGVTSKNRGSLIPKRIMTLIYKNYWQLN